MNSLFPCFLLVLMFHFFMVPSVRIGIPISVTMVTGQDNTWML